METLQASIPYEPGHAPYAVITYGGHQWFVRHVDTASGLTFVERVIPEREEVATVVVVQRHSKGWLVALCAVFLFLALLSANGTRMTFSTTVGVIVGFVVLVLWLDRHGERLH